MKLENHWQSVTWLVCLLWCVSVLYRSLVVVRRYLYKKGVFTVYSSSIPVVVIGNITVGGTGKTPLVIGIAKYLQSKGYSPAIVSRGYGGIDITTPIFVNPDDVAGIVGDEPLLIAKKTKLPVVVCKDRRLAVSAIDRSNSCDVILSDDGLQHYQMQRDIEVLCIDAERKFGNGLCLPAGPLREPLSRLQTVDFIVSKSVSEFTDDSFELGGDVLVSLHNAKITGELHDFANRRVHAIAGIGNPAAFFNKLRRKNILLNEHAFSDHHQFVDADFVFDESLPIIMTEKDAVKCADLGLQNAWYLPVEVIFHTNFLERLETSISTCRSGDGDRHAT